MIVGGEVQFVCRLVWWNVVLVESENECDIILYMRGISRVLHLVGEIVLQST